VTSEYDAAGTAATVVPVALAQRPGGPAEPVAGTTRGRLRWIFAAIWLVYLLPVVQDALAAPQLLRRVLGVAAVAVFGAGYVWSFLAVSRWRRQGWGVSQAWRLRILAFSVTLTVVTAVLVGESALGMLVFVAVQCVFLLPGRAGAVGALGCLVAEEVLTRVVPGWTTLEGLGFAIALAAIAMWGVTGMIERNIELQRAQATIAELAVQTERTRFARDLHDILGHSLTVLTVKAELAGRLVTIEPARAEREIGEVEALARQALADVRAAVAGYREVSLAGELASARAGLEAADIDADLPGTVDDVPAERREVLAWAIREGVTNVVRHSGARHAWVRLDRNGVEIADDGAGPPDGGTDVGVHGLVGLRERAGAAGARVVVARRDGGGFLLTVTW
jgi:two-component system, NarL family, sensor histidine kinase DesK